MRNFFAILIILLFTQSGLGQTENDECVSVIDTLTHQKVFTIVDKMPEVEGGMEILFKELTNIEYPYQDCINSKVLVSFIVTSEGNLIGKRIVEEVCGDKLGNQILHLIDQVKWIPGKCNGKNVPMMFILPVIIDIK